MNRRDFLLAAEDSTLTERQAEAFHARRVRGLDRQAAAEELDTSPSNVDNLERAAHQKFVVAQNSVALAEAVGALDGETPDIGTCAECDEGSSELRPHPEDGDRPMPEMRMVCPDCHQGLAD